MSENLTDAIEGAQFTIESDEGFYVTVSDDLHVYESYEVAVAEIQDILDNDDDAFVAEVSIEGSDDLSVNLEQVGWQRIIRDMN